MSEDIVENLKQPAQWFRIAYMIALAVALYLAWMILTLLIIAQALFGLLTGTDNRNLRELGSGLTQYVRQVLEFLTYNSEFKPFPFAPFPGAQESASEVHDAADHDLDMDVEVHVPESVQAVTAKAAAPAKPPRKRAPAKKAARPQADADGE